jgi:TonB family protein
MIASPTKWEGQVVDHKFVLGQYLGGSKNSFVFLTHCGEANSVKAAIKLIPADPASADLQLSLWRRCAQLSHPNLLRLFEFGRCRMENTAMLYVVMEIAEENLSQILPERPLTPSEARDMLQPVLDALLYLEGKGFVHSSVKPSNILVAADQLKLSADTLWPAGESRVAVRELTPYDPPEFATALFSPPATVWSLGITLVEALTQQIPSSQQRQKGEFPFSESLPAPFLEIVRRALRNGSQERSSLADIANCLHPGSYAPASPMPAPAVSAKPPLAAAAVSPLAVPLSSVTPLPKEQLLRQDSTRPAQPRRQKESSSRSPYLVPAIALVLLVIVMFSISKLWNRHTEAPAAASISIEQPSTALPAVTPVVSAQKKAAEKRPENSLKPTNEKEPAKRQDEPPAAALHAEKPSNLLSKSQVASTTPGEILEQVLPEVSQKARGTIQGRVQVTVRAHVDSAGLVTATELDSPGFSKYFSEQAVQAARRWQFQSPESNGHGVPSEWLLHFEFRQDDTRVHATQVKP